MNKGILYALSAYIFWGLHPIYWKLLKNIPAIDIVSHRIFWSLMFFVLIISIRRNWRETIRKIKSCNNKIVLYLPALLIGTNWFMYIWAVNAGYIIETSLGYFISPLFSVFLGVFFLKENLRTFQWWAVTIAFIGVAATTFLYGHFPWISLFLAGTWSLYGLIRKKSPLSAVEGLTLETGMLSIIVVVYSIFSLSTSGTTYTINLQTALLLIGTGVISGAPLIVFIKGSKMIDLSLLGIMQYIYPTLLFLIGIYVYHEPMNQAKMIGFIFIWVALLLYSLEGTLFLAKKRRLAAESN